MEQIYLRFVILANDPDSARKTGLLIAAAELLDRSELPAEEQQVLREALAWFNKHLPVPSQLEYEEHRRAISWFRSSAHEPIARMWDVARALNNHGILVEVLKTVDPGVEIYSDHWQVVAKPRRGTNLPW